MRRGQRLYSENNSVLSLNRKKKVEKTNAEEGRRNLKILVEKLQNATKRGSLLKGN